MFGRRSSSSDESRANQNGSIRSAGTNGGFFGGNKDPSILSARQKVADAENAEKDADRALIQARAAVRDARDHVKHVEREAKEE
jgi:hypothetical protein